MRRQHPTVPTPAPVPNEEPYAYVYYYDRPSDMLSLHGVTKKPKQFTIGDITSTDGIMCEKAFQILTWLQMMEECDGFPPFDDCELQDEWPDGSD